MMLVVSILLLLWIVIGGFCFYRMAVRNIMNIANGNDDKWYEYIIIFPIVIVVWLIKKVIGNK